MDAFEFRDPVFKGCTRPAMYWGVPYIPLIVVVGTVAWMTTWTTVLILASLLVIIPLMGQVTRTDDQMYRLIGLKLYCRVVHWNRNRKFWRSTMYAPMSFKRR